MHRASLAVLFIALVPRIALALTIGLPPAPFADLDEDLRFSRIDSLEAAFRGSSGEERASIALELGDLYAGTGLSKHLPTAQEYFSEAIRIDPARREAVYRSAIEYSRAGYHGLARGRLEGLLRREPGEPAHLLMLARLEFVEAREQASIGAVHPAYQLYLRALGLAPDDPEALFGAAATALLVGNHQLAHSCCQRLDRLGSGSPEVWLLDAAARYRQDEAQAAWVEYLRAFAGMDPNLRAVFLGADVLVSDEDLIRTARSDLGRARAAKMAGLPEDAVEIDWAALVDDAALREELVERWWMGLDRSPSTFENESELEFWTRLVEADLRFGVPGSGTRGWETLPGEVWVRMGRPSADSGSSRFSPAFDASVAPAPALQSGNVAFDPPERTWSWFFTVDGAPVEVRFSDVTYSGSHWAMAPGSPMDLGVLRNRMTFVEPERQRRLPAFELGVELADFPRGSGSLLETAVSVQGVSVRDPLYGEPDSVIVEWTLYDAEGARLDRTRRVLTDARSLSRLLLASGQPARPASGDPRLALIGARLDPGSYRVRVRAIDPGSGRFTSRTFEVRLPGPSGPERLAMSSVQLSHGLPAWDPRGEFPPELVKHGRAMINAARAVIDGNTLGVYYELEGLGRDGSGRTRFDVEYAIYESSGQVRLLAMLGEFDPSELEEVDLATVRYLQERTGVSPEGLVVKGTELDLSDLAAGDYVLFVRVSDELSGQHCARAVAFRRLARR